MQDFGIMSPIKPALEAILTDYPGGQLLSEALQNAEDSGAKTFSLRLDLRPQDGIGDPNLRGAAFVLIDDGAGFTKREWTSLRNLHDSKKANSPREIGQFGMGSRSYFHYADCITVCSNGMYVGLDPLQIITADKRNESPLPGWMYDLSCEDLRKKIPALKREAEQLFGDWGGKGAAFRLPLRRADQVPDGLGPEVSTRRQGRSEDEWLNPEDLLKRWARSLLDGRLMLFLASVQVVRLERWDIDAAAPTLVAEVTKTFPDGDVPFTRLPVPDAVCTTFDDLSKHLAGKSPAEMQTLAERHEARVQTRTNSADGQTSEALWLVVQRFDINRKLIELMPKALAVPVIGVAVRLDCGHVADPVRSAQEAREIRVQKLEPDTPAPQLEAIYGCGEVFCFLPVSDLPGTGLPVHVNASFKLEKNRRAMFLEKKDYDHKHKLWATWNKVLMSEALPMLWLDMLKSISNSEHGEHLMTFLPNLDITHADWRTCATGLYKLMRSSEILPHDRANDPTASKWVQPAGAHAVAPTSASLQAQAELMIKLYSECASFDLTIVSLPAHVEAACVKHSGLAKYAQDQLDSASFIYALFNEHRQRVPTFDGHRFAPIILALADYGVMKKRTDSFPCIPELWQDRWKQLLSELAWMPISGSNPQTYSLAAKTFLPNQPHFKDMKFSVVQAALADLTCPGASNLTAIYDAAAVFGSKTHMNWDDVVAEAEHVATNSDKQSAFRLLHYIERYNHFVGAATLSRADAVVALKEIAFIPAEDACPDAPLSTDIPPGAQQQELYRPSRLLPSGGRAQVWAAHATDAKDEQWTQGGRPFLTELQIKPTVRHYVPQVKALVQHRYSVHVEHHLLKAFKALLNALFEIKDEHEQQILAMEPLSKIAWVPASLDGDRRDFLKAGRVAMSWENQLWPAFGTLQESWCDELKRYVQFDGVLKATGINIKVPAEMLARELETMAGNQFCDQQLSLVVNLCRELVCRCESDSTVAESYMNHEKVCHVPTTSGTMKPASEVFINDAPWHSEGGRSAELLHEKLDTEAGRILGCTSVRSELARRCEMHFSEDFGQREDLRDRIHSLLNEYNDPFDIFTEHWQNSDDAGADTVKFVLDTGNYPTDSLVDPRPGCKDLQGPALLLASSQPLDDDDVRRIQRLGRSDKQKQFDSTGRFGVGLVCLYHVTDTPTIFANDALHVMDPCHTAVADEPSNGKKWKRDMLSESFPHMLEPFESVDQQDFPTILRLPLRKRYNRELRKQGSTAERVEIDLQKFACQAQELLVFSKHVRTAIFTVKGSSSEWSITARCKPNEHEVLQVLPKTLEEVQALHQSPRGNISHMDITVTTAPSGREVTSTWIVSHRLEANTIIQQLVQQKFNEGTALLPHGAVALRVGAPQDYAGRLCCFLPLAGLYCGPPVLIHGPFALSQSRKQIQLPTVSSAEENSDQQWNQALLRGPIASSLAHLVSELKETVEAGDMTLSKWFEAIELTDDFQKSHKTDGTAQHRSVLREALLEKLLHQRDTFPVVHVRDNGEILLKSLHWHSHIDGGLLLRTPDLGAIAQNALIDTGLRLVHLSASLAQQVVAAATGQDKIPHYLTAGELCAHMRGLNEEQLGTLEPEVCLELLRFVVPPADTRKTSLEFPQLLEGVQLLQDADNNWQKFGEGLQCFWDHARLLPDKPNLFVHENVRCILSKASTSLEDVKSAAQQLGIVEMAPERLVPYRAHVHEVCLHEDESWRETFYQFVWNKFADDEKQKFCCMFGDWKILKVTLISSNGNIISRCVPLRDHNSVFSMHKIDTTWQEDVGKVLLTCGVKILHSDHVSDTNQMQLLEPLVGKDDDHLLDTLNNAVAKLRNRFLDTKTTAQLLKYLQSRRNLTEAQLDKIRALPLFVTEDTNHPWTDLADASVTYVCFSSQENTKQKYTDELRRLTLPGTPVKFLAYPPKGCDDLYRRLRIQLLSTYNFIVDLVCPALPAAAEQGASVLDPLLTVLKRRIDHEKDSKMVTEVAAVQKFVQSKAGGAMVRPSELLDPNLLLAIEFAHEIKNWLPAEHLREHIGLLLKLGLQTNVPSSCLRHCAVVLDETAAKLTGVGSQPVDEATQRQSFCIIDTICTKLEPLFARTSAKGRFSKYLLPSADGMAHEDAPAKEESDLVDILGKYRVAVADGPTQQGQHLQRFKKLLLTPDCVTCAGSCVETLVVDAGRPAEKAHSTRAEPLALQRLIEFHQDAILTKLECYCTPMQLDISTLLLQLRHLVRGKQKIFEKGNLAVHEIHLVLKTLDKKLADDSENLVADKVLLEELRGSPCLPVETTEDAAGETRIQLVSPDRAFQRLQDGAASEPSIPFIETTLHITHPHVAKALGIGQMPTALDWARCTRIIAERTNGQEAAPDEIGAMFFAVRAFLKSDDLSDAPYKICLVDKEAEICSFARAGQLLYKDTVRFSHRCETLTTQLSLQFVRERKGKDNNHSLTPKQLDKLCELTELRRVTDVVRVALSEATECSPTEDDVCFEQFLRSPEFAEAFCACLRHDAHQISDDLDDPEKFDTVQNVVQNSFASLSVCWVRSLDTHLSTAIEGTDKALEDSTKSELTFFNAETLWIRAGVLGGTSEYKDKEDELLITSEDKYKEDQLLEVLSDSIINDIVRAAGAPTLFNTSRINDLLKHWKRGPAWIPRVLKLKDIKISSSEDDSHGRPGALVPATLTELLQQTTLCTFEEKATVAIDCGRGKNGITEYRFAVVRPSKDLRSTVSNSLLRQYRLLCPGLEEQPEIIRPHLEIFMFSRDSLTPDKDELAKESSGASTDPEASLNDAASDWKALVADLREMESLPEKQYKKMLHRLFRQWHPDKCSAEKAEYGARFFDVMRRHEKSFKSEEQDFSWLEGAANADEALGAQPVQVPSVDNEDSDEAPEPGPEPHSWMEEFEREQRSSEQQRKDAAIAEMKWQESVASPRSERRLDPELSDYYWQGARNQQRFATLAFEHDQWNFAVWNFQQVVELSVKALMMRTCGITDFELKGKGAHDLITLMGRICHGEWPVSKGNLRELSTAYLGARYPTSRPTDRRYVESDAKRAMETARRMIDWVIAQDTLPTPDGGEAAEGDDETMPKQLPKHVVLDPAPPPPEPAILSSEPALSPPPSTPPVEARAPAPVLASQPVPPALRAISRPAVQDSDVLQIDDVDLGLR